MDANISLNVTILYNSKDPPSNSGLHNKEVLTQPSAIATCRVGEQPVRRLDAQDRQRFST